jgi:hypothetical protein
LQFVLEELAVKNFLYLIVFLSINEFQFWDCSGSSTRDWVSQGQKQLDNMEDWVQVGHSSREFEAVYEQSNSSYCSHWFTILCKGSGKLYIVHDLHPLNTITICDSGVPPYTEQLAKNCGGCTSYRLLDLVIGYDKKTLPIESHNLTTFQTSLGTLCLR